MVFDNVSFEHFLYYLCIMEYQMKVIFASEVIFGAIEVGSMKDFLLKWKLD